MAIEHLVQKKVGIQLLQLGKDASHCANVLGVEGLQISIEYHINNWKISKDPPIRFTELLMVSYANLIEH